LGEFVPTGLGARCRLLRICVSVDDGQLVWR
jgi:hypothetical protein